MQDWIERAAERIEINTGIVLAYPSTAEIIVEELERPLTNEEAEAALDAIGPCEPLPEGEIDLLVAYATERQGTVEEMIDDLVDLAFPAGRPRAEQIAEFIKAKIAAEHEMWLCEKLNGLDSWKAFGTGEGRWLYRGEDIGAALGLSVDADGKRGFTGRGTE